MTLKSFYFAGHTHFGNRGCEALVRSTVQLLKQQFGPIVALVPSADPERDGRQWPNHREEGVQLVPAPEFPGAVRWWHRGVRVAPFLKSHWMPDARPRPEAEAPLADCDAIVMTGGDVISLDYGLPSLVWNVQLVEPYIRQGKPTVLWGASVGPFSKDPRIERHMAGFLQRLPLVTVRETYSESYLRGLGLGSNLSLVTDPAFNLAPEACDGPYWPADRGNGVLGFNVSPLIQKFRPEGEPPEVLLKEVASFLLDVINRHGMSVLLIPHVDPLDGREHNSDSHYMAKLFQALANVSSRIGMVPATLNAAQLKHILGQVDYFIGARTHATIGAISSGVPTLSIAYSVKAKGLNRDLFGDERYVIETPKVSAAELGTKFDFLREDGANARARLKEVLPQWKARGMLPASLLKAHMHQPSQATPLQ